MWGVDGDHVDFFFFFWGGGGARRMEMLDKYKMSLLLLYNFSWSEI